MLMGLANINNTELYLYHLIVIWTRKPSKREDGIRYFQNILKMLFRLFQI